MRVVMPDKLLRTNFSFFKPYERYVVSDYEWSELEERTSHTQINWSFLASYERRWGGQDLNGKKVIMYRHNAWGDHLIVSAMARYIKMLYPNAILHLYCHPDVMPLWLGNPFVDGSAIPLPIPFDAVKHYDYHIFFEGMLEANSEPDQGNCYDDMFSFVGLQNVPNVYKRPCIFPMPEDYVYFNTLGLKSFVLYHFSPNNMNRSYPFKKSVNVISELAKDHTVVVVGTPIKETDTAAMVDALGDPNVVNLIGKTKSFRQIIPFVERASVLICPDSSVMHLAACFSDTPVVSLWGLFHPDDRIKYYPNSYPIFHPEICPTCPCHDHNFFLPTTQCKDAKGAPAKEQIKWCWVLASITEDEIIERARSVMR